MRYLCQIISNAISKRILPHCELCIDKCFVHPNFRFWFLVIFGNEVTKIQNYYIVFVYILQGKMGKTEKKEKKITQPKCLKYQKTKDENMGLTKQN